MITKINDNQIQVTIIMSIEEVANLPRNLHAVVRDMMVGYLSDAGRDGIYYMIQILDEAMPDEAQFVEMFK